MVKDIAYQGYTSNTSDYECTDGQLAMSLGLIHEDGHLKPVFQPKDVGLTLSTGFSVRYIHKTSSYTHYIIVGASGKLQYIDKAAPGTSIAIDNNSSPKILNISSLGNTLCVSCGDGIYYYLWENTKYTKLGKKFPDLRLSFGLQCNIVKSDDFVVNFWGTDKNSNGTPIPVIAKESVDELTETILSRVNKLLSDEVNDSGRFAMPFFVRYAYRLFDGSLTYQSAPILMLPTNGVSPIVLSSDYIKTTGNVGTDRHKITCNLRVYAPSCKLDMRCVNYSGISTSLDKFKDIIKSVDIFVSTPIYSYDQNGKCTDFSLTADDKSFGIFSLDNLSDTVPTWPTGLRNTLKKYNKWNVIDAIRTAHADGCIRKVVLPSKSDGEIYSGIAENSSFYFLKSIELSELSTYNTSENAVRKTIEMDKGYLKALVTKEALPDDYDSRCTLIAKKSFIYNSRLHLYGLKKILYGGYFAQPYCNALFSPNYSIPVQDDWRTPYVQVMSVSEIHNCPKLQKVFVYVNKDGKNIKVQESINDEFIPTEFGSSSGRATTAIPFFYYPDANAYKAVFLLKKGQIDYVITLPLKAHSMLNGAFYFDSFAGQLYEGMSPVQTTPTVEQINLSNKIYVSEVDNPFMFPVTGIVSVGTGEVIGLGCAAKALSQGQFGQFPLYAFTNEGVWSLGVSSTGSYMSVQPFSYDICNNPDSITPVDSSVVFTTERGIMLIQGSDCACISDTIYSEYTDAIIDKLPNSNLLYQNNDVHLNTYTGNFSVKPFVDFVKNCQILYDYLHQRLIVFNNKSTQSSLTNSAAAYNYAYVFSLKSKSWGMMISKLIGTIIDYPCSLAVTKDNRLVDFGDTNDATTVSGMFVTRPIKFDAPDILKEVHVVSQRGMFKREDVNTVLYGSRDLYNWFLVGSSAGPTISRLRGTPYKYFRVAGVAKLSKSKSLHGVSFDVETRYTNKLR